MQLQAGVHAADLTLTPVNRDGDAPLPLQRSPHGARELAAYDVGRGCVAGLEQTDYILD